MLEDQRLLIFCKKELSCCRFSPALLAGFSSTEWLFAGSMYLLSSFR
jgi:hypothetical protein